MNFKRIKILSYVNMVDAFIICCRMESKRSEANSQEKYSFRFMTFYS